LKAAEWFRLVRLVMVSPDPRHHRRCQAANSTYRPVQIPRASSKNPQRALLSTELEQLNAAAAEQTYVISNISQHIYGFPMLPSNPSNPPPYFFGETDPATLLP
jgi:hypothetical protein